MRAFNTPVSKTFKHFPHTLTPAYGRDYTSATDAIQAFKEGKDWVANGRDGSSTYCSIRDVVGEAYTHATLRYNKLSRVVVAEV